MQRINLKLFRDSVPAKGSCAVPNFKVQSAGALQVTMAIAIMRQAMRHNRLPITENHNKASVKCRG